MMSIAEYTVKGSLIGTAHQLVREVVKEGDVAVDATLGNGHDTLFLADCVGPGGMVIGFDIQQEAIDATRARLRSAGIDEGCYQLHLASHAMLAEYAPDHLAVVMFNLGYLPGSDKTTITHTESTLEAIRQAMNSLADGGLLSVMCYPGHEGGDNEAASVRARIEQSSETGFQVACYQREGAKPTTPFLLVAKKTADS